MQVQIKEIQYLKKFSKLVLIKVSNLPIFARLCISKAVKIQILLIIKFVLFFNKNIFAFNSLNLKIRFEISKNLHLNMILSMKKSIFNFQIS